VHTGVQAFPRTRGTTNARTSAGMRRGGARLLALALLLGHHAGSGDSLEPRSDHGVKCRNSVQGRSMLLDENGWLCELAHVDWETGCCVAGRAAEERYSCRTCEEETKCCEVQPPPLCPPAPACPLLCRRAGR